MVNLAQGWKLEAEGVNELRSFPKVRDYESLWDQLSRVYDSPDCRIVDYGQITNSGRDYTLRAIEVGDVENSPVDICLLGTHPYERGPWNAAKVMGTDNRFKERADEHGKLIIPSPYPIAYEHDLRFIVGLNGKQEVIVDTNRDVFLDPSLSKTQEARFLSEYIQTRRTQGVRFGSAFDGHETPDTDITIWRPFAAKYKGRILTDEDKIVPQGAFVIVQAGQTEEESFAQEAFGRAVINAMGKHTPIAPEPTLLGYANKGGVAVAPYLEGSMRSFLREMAPYAVVTEGYPDLPELRDDPERIVDAQLEGLYAAMDYVSER